MNKVLFFTSLLLLLQAPQVIAESSGECEAYSRKHKKPSDDHFDITGSVSSLRSDIPLKCLKLINIGTIQGVRVAVVNDVDGINYFLKVGDYIGENNGIVVEIYEKSMVIQQRVIENGYRKKVRVVFK